MKTGSSTSSPKPRWGIRPAWPWKSSPPAAAATPRIQSPATPMWPTAIPIGVGISPPCLHLPSSRPRTGTPGATSTAGARTTRCTMTAPMGIPAPVMGSTPPWSRSPQPDATSSRSPARTGQPATLAPGIPGWRPARMAKMSPSPSIATPTAMAGNRRPTSSGSAPNRVPGPPLVTGRVGITPIRPPA